MSKEWSRYFEYSEESPTFLINKIDRRRARAGSPVGTVRKDGYIVISLEDKLYYAHIIIYELHHGPVPVGFDIDHEDGCPTNCKIDNLRVVPHAVNTRNNRKNKRNSSGVNGVSLASDRLKRKSKWRAFWRDLEGNLRSASFAIAKYGYEEAFNLAVQARQEAIQQLNNLQAGYTERHGT